MNQTEFTATSTGATQNQKLVSYLMQRANHWVPMPELVQAIGSFSIHSRASDLRRKGHNIEQRSERVGKQVHSFYRLVMQ